MGIAGPKSDLDFTVLFSEDDSKSENFEGKCIMKIGAKLISYTSSHPDAGALVRSTPSAFKAVLEAKLFGQSIDISINSHVAVEKKIAHLNQIVKW